jgi:hypothetical protein
VHFRSEAARVASGDDARTTRILRSACGRGRTIAYMGEHWRCRVRMGAARSGWIRKTPMAVGTACVQVPVGAPSFSVETERKESMKQL